MHALKALYFLYVLSRSFSNCNKLQIQVTAPDDVRLFGFIRITTGDAMSKRAKFTLITWIGENVSGLQRAKISTDKTLVKDVVQNFAKEFVISDRRELEEDYIKNELKKAGGANYDAQAE
ncbi:UNVERIFIED_CONTAM: hypothetical protein FKN15_028918 [Acipenser sinensis]